MNVGPPAEKRLHGLQTGWADVTGSDRCGWTAVRQNGSLSSRRGTAIQNFRASTGQLRNQLRSLILNALASTHDKSAWFFGGGRLLIVTADRGRSIQAKRSDPPIDHPGRMSG